MNNVNLWMKMVNLVNWFGFYQILVCLTSIPSPSPWRKRRVQPNTSVKHHRAIVSEWLYMTNNWQQCSFPPTVDLTKDVVISYDVGIWKTDFLISLKSFNTRTCYECYGSTDVIEFWLILSITVVIDK